MSVIAIIGGTGLTELENLDITHEKTLDTPYGAPSGPLVFGKIGNIEAVFLARHGSHHTIPPHKVNYRANLWALKEVGVGRVISVAAVGGISEKMEPESVVIPEQIIDYTYGRLQTYFDDDLNSVTHIDFTWPYNEALRKHLLEGCRRLNISIIDKAVYAATQGPRLESAAEIIKLERDGCDIVGMTGMPEAALARELALEYACCALVVNWAAGKGGQQVISLAAMQRHLALGMQKIRQLLEIVLPEACA
jgi:5'-deoxy-5'-methylthioadenosine phosphorylase